VQKVWRYIVFIGITLGGVFFAIALGSKPEWLKRSERKVEKLKKKDKIKKKDVDEAEKVVKKEEDELVEKINEYHELVEENNKKIEEAGDSVEKPKKIKDPAVAVNVINDAVTEFRNRYGSSNGSS
jgi:esterase/lipase